MLESAPCKGMIGCEYVCCCAGAADEAAQVESLNAMSTPQLKHFLEARGVSTAGMLERGDLVAAAASVM